MTRKEYLDRLSASLKGMSGEEKKDITLEMESHIEELAAKRPELGEPELMGTLTPPEALAERLSEECRGKSECGEVRNKREGGREDAFFSGSDFFKSFVKGIIGLEGGKKADIEGAVQIPEASRLRIGFSSADLELRPSKDGMLNYLISVMGAEDAVAAWKPRILQEEGFISLDDEEAHTLGIRVQRAKIGIPRGSGIVDLRLASGDISLHGVERGLVIDTHSGDVELRDIVGDSEISMVSGDLSAKNIQGSLKVGSASGDMECSRISGSVCLRSASGDINVKETSGEARLESVSGDLEYHAMEAFSGASLRSVSGDVAVRLHSSPDIDVFAESLSGGIKILGEKAGGGKPGWRKLKKTLGKGGTELRLKTVSGDIELSYRLIVESGVRERGRKEGSP
jgi:hypothetical protein